jgi:hypothetical protein
MKRIQIGIAAVLILLVVLASPVEAKRLPPIACDSGALSNCKRIDRFSDPSVPPYDCVGVVRYRIICGSSDTPAYFGPLQFVGAGTAPNTDTSVDVYSLIRPPNCKKIKHHKEGKLHKHKVCKKIKR